jgi:hypothetical protein
MLNGFVDFMVSSVSWWYVSTPKKAQPCTQGRADRFGGGAADYDAAAVKRHRPESQTAFVP